MEQVKVIIPAIVLGVLLATAAAQAQPGPPATSPEPLAAGQPPGPSPVKEDLNLTVENSLSVRDPFRSPVRAAAVIKAIDPSQLPELERFELDKYKLVAVITGPKKAKALVTAPSGKMHIVERDMRIGIRRGIIRKILPGMLTVEEKTMNMVGQEESIESVIEMKQGRKEGL